MHASIFSELWWFTFEEQHEVLLVIGALGVLPVHVEAVEVVSSEVRDGAVDECLPGVPCRRHHLELLRAKRPSTCDIKLI